ncbi:MAG TPA: hypothetical protein VMD59_15980 [Acidimicrobiales bacterium]|nr:hypothetical protein [Acidimicrobiales bacterium]
MNPLLMPELASKLRSRATLTAAGLVAAGGYSWFAGGTRPFTTPAGALTGATYAVAVPLAWWAMQRRRSGRDTPEAGPAHAAARTRVVQLSAWIVTFVLVGVFELVMYLSGPRRSHPTISSLIAELAQGRSGRSLVFLLWLLLGWVLVGR